MYIFFNYKAEDTLNIISEKYIDGLEHFNIFCSDLGRREDKAGKEDSTAILKYCEHS